MTIKRFQRPINEYAGAEELLYTNKYQQDSQSVPKIAISSAKVDGDFNYLIDAVNTLDEDVKSIVYSGIANETILEEHISAGSVSESKLANKSVSSRTIQEGSVTNAKITDLAVTTPKIANNSVTQDKLASDSVGTQELIDGSITKDKLAPDAISDSVPVGTIAYFSIETLPTGWILCNGATVSKNTYPQLVKFLTSSDTILEATLPYLNTDSDALVNYAIKAFSDSMELGNLDIAGLTQDVANNAADILDKADISAEAIATGYITGAGVLSASYGIYMITKLATGKYKIYLNDELKGKVFDTFVTTANYSFGFAYNYDYVNGTVDICNVHPTGSYADGNFVFRIYERRD